MNRFDVDVLVIGGGCAGVSAGVTAARKGLRTLLVENMNSLGGLMTNGYVTGPAGLIDGICKELLERLDKKGYLHPTAHTPTVDPEMCKIEMEEMLMQAGCRILYGVHAVDTIMDGETLQAVICYGKSGRFEISAKIFIDATGDGDIAAAAGAPYDVGDAEYCGLSSSHTQGCRVSGVNWKAFRAAQEKWISDNNGYPENFTMHGESMDQAVADGLLPYPIFPGGLIYKVPGTPDDYADVTFNCAHAYYCRTTDTEDLSRQIIEQHQQNLWLIEAFRKYVPGFEKSYISSISNLPGIRDSRRIIGEYVLKDEDIASGAKFEDAIAQNPEGYDTHHPTNGYWGFRHHIHSKEPIPGAINMSEPCAKSMHPFCPPEEGSYAVYQNPANYNEVPYRCLVPLKVNNLLVAGRCISTEYHSTSSVRIITICMATGMAAGMAANLAIKQGKTPREVDGAEVRQEMIRDGVALDQAPGGYWEMIRELAKSDEGKHENVRLRGDLKGIRLEDGTITIRHGLVFQKNSTESEAKD